MKKPQLIIGIGALIAGVAILVLLLFSRSAVQEKKSVDSVIIQKDGNTLTVSKDGSVRYETDRGKFEDFWDSEKVNTFFGYLGGKYKGSGSLITGGENYIAINSGGGSTTYELGDDELIDAVEEETGGGGGGPPSPTATAGQGGSGGAPTPTPGPGGSGTGFPTPTPYNPGGPDPECLYWRLSYCVRPRTPSPSPSSTPAPVEIREPDCGDNTQTGRTVIGNDLCISTPSPSPTP